MQSALEIIAAGGTLDDPPDAERAACISAMEPVIRDLQRGIRTGSIIAALAQLTVNAQQLH